MFKFSKKGVYSIMFLVIATVLLCANISTSQGIIYVPSQYATIQFAVNASSNGDTVVVADGTYTGSGNTNIDFLGKAITVKSENGPNNCIIDCQNIENKMGFYLHSGETNNSVIEGFTIQNGNRNIIPNHQGGGIYCSNASPTIKNNIIKNNYGFYGGGICSAAYSVPIITGNIIIQNSANDGGGIYLSLSPAIIVNNLIVSNTASFGSGIFVQSYSSPKIINNTIVNNTGSNYDSSGILCHNNTTPPPEIVNCIIAYNSVTGIINRFGPAPIVTYSDVQDGWGGVGNINADPLFVDSNNNNYRLMDNSPCIGNGTMTANVPIIDIEGRPRPNPLETLPDMGAYENGPVIPSNNLPPDVGNITATQEPIQAGTQIAVSAEFTDPDPFDTHTAIWNWGDGSTSAGTVTETKGSGTVSGSHTYTVAGVYTLTLTVTDDDGNSGQSIFQYIVIYNPDAGFVTGAGLINSPIGAYAANPSLTGKANFGFVSKYQKGANVPTGNTRFKFHLADLDFNSTEYEWMIIAGAKAQYKGSGKINNVGDFRFMLTAIDGQIKGNVDKFRIRIWVDGGGIVYDNQMGKDENGDFATEIDGGSIVIHKGDDKAAPPMNPIAKLQSPKLTRLLPAFPNPFNPETWIPYQLADNVDVAIRIYNASGLLVRTLNLGNKSSGFYTSKDKAAYWDGRNEAGEQVSSGIYFYNIQAGDFSATKKMIVKK